MNFQLCGKMNFSPEITIQSPSRKRKEAYSVDGFLANTEFSKRYLYNHILNKLVQATGSEAGMLGKVRDDTIYVCAATNIAWDIESSQFFFEDFYMKEPPTALFGSHGVYATPQIVNVYQNHPVIHRFLSVPCVIGKTTIALVGLYNKKSEYTVKDAEVIADIFSKISFAFV